MTIRVGIIGLNYGRQVHLPAYKANPKYEVMAVCARTPGHAEAVAQEFNIPNWYTEARQLIASNEIDLISIASPPYTHSGYAAAALAAGKHVVVEIAFVCSAADARILADISSQMGRLGVPAYVLRYTPTLRMVTDMLQQQRLGQVRLMRFELFNNFLVEPGQGYRWIWDSSNGGGILAGFTSQGFDLARHWFGPVKEVDGTLLTFSDVTSPAGAGPLADDTGFVTLHFENGMIATFSHSAVMAYPHTSIEVHGSEGSLLIEGLGDEVAWLPMGGQTTQRLFPPEVYLEETRGHGGLTGGFRAFLEQLGGAIVDGVPPTSLPTLADGLEVTRLVEAARLASRERRRVRLEEIE
jgi:predicted dehydrogenase